MSNVYRGSWGFLEVVSEHLPKLVGYPPIVGLKACCGFTGPRKVFYTVLGSLLRLYGVLPALNAYTLSYRGSLIYSI